MYKRFFSPPKHSYFLFGPRGTGKSTWLKQHYRNAYWIDLLDPALFRFFAAAPERLQKVLEPLKNTRVVVIDEVQKVPELLNVVHSLIESKQGYQFILTGSSSRKLKQQGVNLLAGRALLKHMSPFFAGEMGKDFSLDRSLRLGMLPIVHDSEYPEEVLRAYGGMYLKEEVQNEGIVRNVGDFARFLEVMSFSHGSLLNASNIARECQIARKTIDSYLLVLEDLLLAFHLSAFHHRAKRALVQHQKFYYFDCGVFASLRPQNAHDRNEELAGPALEGLVAQHLKAWVDDQREMHRLYFWRTSSNVEVDFVVYGPSCFLAIEVKNGSIIHPGDLKGLKAFAEDYPEVIPILLYRGKHVVKENKILCYPIDQFLLGIHPAFPLPVKPSS